MKICNARGAENFNAKDAKMLGELCVSSLCSLR